MRLWPLLLLVFCVASCKKSASNSLVGTWQSAHQGVIVTWHFHPAGKLAADIDFRGSLVHVDGTYEVSGDQLTMNTTAAQALTPTQEAEQVKSTAMGPSTARMYWHTPANFQLDPPGTIDPLILNRLSPSP